VGALTKDRNLVAYPGNKLEAVFDELRAKPTTLAGLRFLIGTSPQAQGGVMAESAGQDQSYRPVQLSHQAQNFIIKRRTRS